MSSELSIQILLRRRREQPLTPDEWKRAKARAAWVKGRLDAWQAAQQHMDEVCTEAVDRLFGSFPSPLQGRGRSGPPGSDEPNGSTECPRREGEGDQADAASWLEFNHLFEAEEAKVAAIRAQIDAVIQEGRWPPHLYWSAI